MGRNKQPQDAPVAAFITEEFLPGHMDIEAIQAAPGKPARIKLRLYVGPAGVGNLYHQAKVGVLTPEVAIQLGEALVKQAREVKTGLEIPTNPILRP